MEIHAQLVAAVSLPAACAGPVDAGPAGQPARRGRPRDVAGARPGGRLDPGAGRHGHVRGRLDGDNRILLTTGPRGETFLTRGHEDSDELTVHRTSDLAELDILRTADLEGAGEKAGCPRS